MVDELSGVLNGCSMLSHFSQNVNTILTLKSYDGDSVLKIPSFSGHFFKIPQIYSKNAQNNRWSSV